MRQLLKSFLALVFILSPALAALAQSTVPLNLQTTQVSCAATATQAAPLRGGRPSITLENTTTTAIYIGPSTVTTTTGMLLPGIVGASLTIPAGAPVYCVVATGTATITVLEVY